MAKRKKRKRKSGRQTSGRAPASQPMVHVKVALADNDLRAATALIKPAVLYADRVTIHSPVASLLTGAMSLGALTDRRQQIDAVLEIVSKVPSLAGQLDVAPEVLEQMKAFLSVDRRLVRQVGRAYGSANEIDALYEKLGELDEVWEKQIPQVLGEIRAKFGADELLNAMENGPVAVADLGTTSNTDYVAASIRAATGERDDGELGDVIADFTDRLIEILTERRSFPLLDDTSADLARAMEREGAQIPSHSMRRGAEVSSAVSYMGYLPSFEQLGMDEILDLRIQLSGPLSRFRGALARLSREFEMRPIDEGFETELENAWREQIAPALSEIRETLAEHGLLKEIASISLGDPRRLMVEAGGVIAAGNGEVLSLPGLMTAGLALGVPVADTVGRAVGRKIDAQREVRKNAFFFLHRLEVEASRRSRA